MSGTTIIVSKEIGLSLNISLVAPTQKPDGTYISPPGKKMKTSKVIELVELIITFKMQDISTCIAEEM